MKSKKFLSFLLYGCLACTINAQGNFQWAKGLGGLSSDAGNAIVTDASGNVYTIGSFGAQTDFDPGAAVYYLTPAGGYDVFVSKLDALGNFVWALQFGGTSNDYGTTIAVDGAGNVYATGLFSLTVDFDPGTGVSNLTSTGSYDMFIVKLDASGALVWAKQFAGSQIETGYSVAIDTTDNVYITGYFSGTADFDTGAGVFNMTSPRTAGEWDIFICKLDVAGSFVWAKQMGGGNNDVAVSLKLDNMGNIYTTGYFQLTADFDPGAGVFNLSSAGSSGFSDAFVCKLDNGGNLIWAKQLGGAGWDIGYGIGVDQVGDIYICGIFEGTSDFDPGSGVFNFTSAGSASVYDSFICKLDGSGSFIWAKQIGGTSNEYSNSLALDAAGNVYAAGNFQATVDFDPGTGIFNLTSAGGDVFIYKLDAAGTFVWAKRMGGPFSDYCYSIAVDPGGNVHATGVFQGTADFDPGPGTFNLVSAGADDAYIVKLCQVPAKPMAIAGPTLICSGSSAIYSVGAVPGATMYTWTIPGNWTGTGTTNTISIIAGTTNGIISVIANNACGASGTQTISAFVDPCLSIDTSFSDQTLVSVYPNPGQGSFNIEISDGSANEILIYNNLGQLVYSKNISSGSNNLTVDLAAGIYQYLIVDENKILNRGNLSISK